MIQTNHSISPDSELGQKAAALVQAGYDYWKEYQKVCGTAAVVWVEVESGHFILFTRGEYRDDLLRVARSYHGEAPLIRPFG